jgi:mono/diheme cytochrome c family protein
MRAIPLVAVAVCIATAAHADPFPNGDAAKGKALVDKSCSACHVARFGGDGSTVYTRPDRIVTNSQQLLARVETCNVNSGAGWCPEEEVHASAYLNGAYYHFK